MDDVPPSSEYRNAGGIQAVEHHRKAVRFFATVDLVSALEQEMAMNKVGQLADRLPVLDDGKTHHVTLRLSGRQD